MFVKIILYFAEPSCLLKYEYGILKDGPYRNGTEILFSCNIFYWNDPKSRVPLFHSPTTLNFLKW